MIRMHAVLSTLALLAAGTPAAAAAAEAAAAVEAGPAWERIFDGRTLDGWTPKITGRALGEDPRGTFTVRDGAIRVSYAGYTTFGGEFGHLFWKAPLSAYRVRFEYRLRGKPLPDVEPWQVSNSGLMFHAQPPATMRRDQDFPVSLEFQLLGLPRPTKEPSGNLCTPGTVVTIAGRRELSHCIPASGAPLPNGRWIRAALEVLPDGRVTHFIDGKPVLHYAMPELDPTDADAQPLIAAAGGAVQLRRGYIALQAEGHAIEFRNIELQRIGPE